MSGITSMSNFKPTEVESIKAEAESLEKQKYDDEAKYTKLHLYFEDAIKKVEDELMAKQTKLRDHVRAKTHNKRLQQINEFYKKKKIKDEIRRKKEERRLKEYQELLAGKSRPTTEEQIISRNMPEDVIAEEKSRISDDSRTQDFYQASSDDEEKRIKPLRVKRAELDNSQNDLSEAKDITEQILNDIPDPMPMERPIANQKRNVQHIKREEDLEPPIKNNQITTAPVGNNKVPELKNNQMAHEVTFLKQDAVEPQQPKRSQLTKPGFALKK